MFSVLTFILAFVPRRLTTSLPAQDLYIGLFQPRQYQFYHGRLRSPPLRQARAPHGAAMAELALTHQARRELLDECAGVLRDLRRELEACSGPLPAHLAPLGPRSLGTLFEVGTPRSTQHTTLGLMVGDGGLVTHLLPGAPAARSRQIAVGDHIIAVDDISTLLLGSDVAIGTLLLGSDVAGSTVQLRLRSQRDHLERDVVLERMPVSSIHHRKRLFEIFCILQDVSAQLQAPATESPFRRPLPATPGSAGASPGAPAAVQHGSSAAGAAAVRRPRTPSPTPSPTRGAHSPSTSTPPAPDQIRSRLVKAVEEGVKLWSLMVEEEDARTDRVRECCEAGALARAEAALARLSDSVQCYAADTQKLESCLASQQAELSDLCNALRDASAKHTLLEKEKGEAVSQLAALQSTRAANVAAPFSASVDGNVSLVSQNDEEPVLRKKAVMRSTRAAPVAAPWLPGSVDDDLPLVSQNDEQVFLRRGQVARSTRAAPVAAPRLSGSVGGDVPLVSQNDEQAFLHSRADKSQLERKEEETRELARTVAQLEEQVAAAKRSEEDTASKWAALEQQVHDLQEVVRRAAEEAQRREEDAEIQRSRAQVQELNTPPEQTGSSNTGAESALASPRVDFPRGTLVHHAGQRPLRTARNKAPVKQTAKAREVGEVGRCQALWALAREDSYRPVMLVNALALMGMLAAVCAMFVTTWASRRTLIPGVM